MLQDIMPGTEEQLNRELTTGYVGFDPTASSLGIGNLVPVMLLKHFQDCGHKPLALVGGATGMIGDPSGKSAERNLLSEDILQNNIDGQKKQLMKFLDFGKGLNSAEMVNNYDWFKNMDFLGFLRDVGKHITVNYMLSKDSVQKRMESGISFTEFSYQLVQGFDFYHLFKNRNCKFQMGGSDQWGNILTGTELIRRKDGGEAFALTCPLVTKADGTKFGKTESGNIWLDPVLTSPYKFYQFWLNASDEDASKYIRIFTFLKKEEINTIESQHAAAPHQRLLQKALAKEITSFVHSSIECQKAESATGILFGASTSEVLSTLSEEDLLSALEGVPRFNISKSELEAGINIIDLLSDKTGIFPSRGEARKTIQGGGVSINKEKVADPSITVFSGSLLNNKYLLIQKGKKNNYLLKAG